MKPVKECNCEKDFISEIEKRFKPTLVYEIKTYCPKCGISSVVTANTDKVKGFRKWCSWIDKNFKKAQS